MKGMLSWVAAAVLLAAPAAQAQDETVFRPSGNWTADYGDDYCRLIRNFTDGTREFSLALERLQPGALVRMIVVGEGMRPFRGAEQIAYQFLPAGSSGKARYVRSESADGKSFVSFDPVTLAQAAFTPGAPPAMYDRTLELEAARGITHADERSGRGWAAMPLPSGSASPGSSSWEPSSPSGPASAQPGRPTHSVVVW